MSEESIEQKTQEQALLQVLVQQLEEAKDQGLQLPVSVQPPAQPTEQPTPLEGSVTTETPVQATEVTKKRKLETTPVMEKKTLDEPAEAPAPLLEKHSDAMAIETEKEEVKTPAKKLTVEDIKVMSEADLTKLQRSDVSHLTKQDLAAAKVPLGKRNILRPLLEPELDKAREGLEKKRAKTTSNLETFNSVTKNIRLAGGYDKHYGGSSDADRNFKRFVDINSFDCQSLVSTVIRSPKVAGGECISFNDSTAKMQLFGVTIDLQRFFGDNLMRGTTLRAGVFTDYIEVFHVGPGS